MGDGAGRLTEQIEVEKSRESTRERVESEASVSHMFAHEDPRETQPHARYDCKPRKKEKRRVKDVLSRSYA